MSSQAPDTPAPAPLHAVPLARLLDHPDAPGWMAWDWDVRNATGWADLERRVEGGGLRERPTAGAWNGYRFVAEGDWPEGVLAALAPDGAVAGGILDGNLFVCKPHRGNGLAAAIVALAFGLGIKRPGERVQLSQGGRATRRAAHRLAVGQALARGEALAPEVMADYPGLPGCPPRA